MQGLLNQIADIIADKYLFSEQANAVADYVRNLQLIEDDEPHAIADYITSALVEITSDKHFLVEYAPEKTEHTKDHQMLLQEHTERSRQQNFGIAEVKILENNVGYVKLTEIAHLSVVREKIDAVVILLRDSHAMMLDLCECGGGSATTVQYIASIFLDAGLPLSGIQWRDGEQYTVETLPELGCERLLTMPLYILTSDVTFSAAEALTYDLKVHQRATIVGKQTRGGAHLSEFFVIENRWKLSVPIARALNPMTNDNWEGLGITPDIKTEKATSIAHKLATARDTIADEQ